MAELEKKPGTEGGQGAGGEGGQGGAAGAGGAGGNGAAGGAGGTVEQQVPLGRFNRIYAEKQQLQERLDAIEAERRPAGPGGRGEGDGEDRLSESEQAELENSGLSTAALNVIEHRAERRAEARRQDAADVTYEQSMVDVRKHFRSQPESSSDPDFWGKIGDISSSHPEFSLIPDAMLGARKVMEVYRGVYGKSSSSGGVDDATRMSKDAALSLGAGSGAGGKKVWTTSEIDAMPNKEFIKHEEEIDLARSEGRVKVDTA